MFIGKTNAEALVLGHLMRRADSLEKTLLLGKTERRRRRRWQRMRWGMNLSKLEETVKNRRTLHVAVCAAAKSEHDLATEQ